MREEIQCLIDWLESKPSDDKAHRILRALAKESLNKAESPVEKRRFTNKEIVAAANEPIEENNANKWVNWKKTVIPFWNTRKKEVQDFARKRRLTTYPEIGYHLSAGGRGNESLYWLKSEPLPDISEQYEENNSQQGQNDTLNGSRMSVEYDLAENGAVKPSWLVKWLLHDGQIHLSNWHIWSIFSLLTILGVSTLILSYISWIGFAEPRPITTRELTTFIAIFVLPFTVWYIFIRPWVRLFDDRIIEAPDLLLSIKEKSAQLELYREDDLRVIRLVNYTAPCPVCGSTIYLENGEPDYPRRLIGRCSDSPREHLFSFDRVTRKGAVLRCPII
jgi:hypothetical protein